MEQDKIYFASTEQGEDIIFYCLTLSAKELESLCKHLGYDAIDLVQVKQEELQYYIIDFRIYIDTPEKERIVRKSINQKK